MSNADDLAAKVAELEKELAAQKAELDKLKPAAPDVPKKREPWPRYDPTEGFRLPPSAAQAMARVFPDIKDRKGFDAHAHAQTKPSEPGGFGPPNMHSAAKPIERGSGYVKAQPLEPPSGISHCDRIADHFADIDRGEAVKRALAAAIGKTGKS